MDFVTNTVKEIIRDGICDSQVRCVESSPSSTDHHDLEEREKKIADLIAQIKAAKLEVETAERKLETKQELLQSLRTKLESQSSSAPPGSDQSRASVVRRWRVAGIKLRAGLGQFKHRDMSCIDSFISTESEVGKGS